MGILEWIAVHAVLAIACTLVWIASTARERRLLAELSARDPAGDDVLERLFAGGEFPPEIPIKLRHLIEDELGVPRDKLLPDDDFSCLCDDMEDIELVMEIEQAFRIQIDPTQVVKLTLRDLAQLVRRIQQEKPRPRE